MKKTVLLLILSILLASCSTIRVSDVTQLAEGMSKAEVDRLMGNPVRILSTDYTQIGIVESFEYHTYRSEAYAVEFLNGRLIGYDFMYEIAPPRPNRPIAPIRPNRPSTPNRPGTTNRPGESNRPGSSRPEGSTRPNSSENTNSGKPIERSRPANKDTENKPITREQTTSKTKYESNNEWDL